MTKETLRQHYKSLRASLDTEAVADQSIAIANQVLQLPIWEYHQLPYISTHRK